MAVPAGLCALGLGLAPIVLFTLYLGATLSSLPAEPLSSLPAEPQWPAAARGVRKARAAAASGEHARDHGSDGRLEARATLRSMQPAAPEAARAGGAARVYIYDLSDVFGEAHELLSRLSNETRQPGGCTHAQHECGLRQFAHELELVALLRQAPFVTAVPDDADLFLVPFPSTLALMYARSLRSRDCRRCVEMEARLLALLAGEHARRWSRCGGHDHVFLSLRCPTAHGHEMANRGYAGHLFNSFREPLTGIHLCLEPPPDAPDARARDGDDGADGAVGARAAHRPSDRFHAIVVPSLVDFPTMVAADYEARTAPKSTLLFFQGAPLNDVRTVVIDAMRRSPADCRLLPQFSRFTLTRPAEHAEAMARATFCFCPRGDTAIAKRQYDAVASRCIPVVVADDAEWAFARRTPPAAFSLRVREAEIVAPANRSGGERLLDTLRSLPAPRVAELQRGLAAAWRRFRYGGEWAAGEVLDSAIDELADRVRVLRELGCVAGGPAVREAAADAALWTARLRARFDELFPPPARVPVLPLTRVPKSAA